MKQMAHRTTFALDRDTARRLRRLAAAWRVSQAEVVRRAVALAERHHGQTDDPTRVLRELHEGGRSMVREEAEAYLAEVDEARRSWRGEE